MLSALGSIQSNALDMACGQPEASQGTGDSRTSAACAGHALRVRVAAEDARFSRATVQLRRFRVQACPTIARGTRDSRGHEIQIDLRRDGARKLQVALWIVAVRNDPSPDWHPGWRIQRTHGAASHADRCRLLRHWSAGHGRAQHPEAVMSDMRVVFTAPPYTRLSAYIEIATLPPFWSSIGSLASAPSSRGLLQVSGPDVQRVAHAPISESSVLAERYKFESSTDEASTACRQPD